ncbi:MAG: glycosyltransferase family 9 protein [Caulobacteraceae bacterium]|nr:glycosyltransferase family 9 protein [Caulobacteraceae bacterium]
MSPRTGILVIKLSALGDMILAFPAFARIRAAHPDARITLLTTPPFAELARSSPFFDAVDPGGRPRRLSELFALARRLRQARYARVYDLQNVDRTNLYFQLLRPFPPTWSGVAAGCALPHRNRFRMRMHTLERQAEQLNHAGLAPVEPVDPGAAAPPDVGWLAARAAPVERTTRPLALLVPGASPRRPLKVWPAENFASLARTLLGEGFAVSVVGGPAETVVGQEIAAGAPGARDLTGRTSLAELARLGEVAAVAVGNDTGPMHLLAAAGAPTVSLFSADSNPDLCAPRGRVRVIRSAHLDDLEVSPVVDAALDAAALCHGPTS